jgi:membrane-associated HD superfamily phosphohydrolase
MIFNTAELFLLIPLLVFIIVSWLWFVFQANLHTQPSQTRVAMQPFVSQVTPIGIRKRNVISEKVEDIARSPVVNRLKKVDIFPKVKNVATIRTNVGAIGTRCTIVYLLAIHFSFNFDNLVYIVPYCI